MQLLPVVYSLITELIEIRALNHTARNRFITVMTSIPTIVFALSLIWRGRHLNRIRNKPTKRRSTIVWALDSHRQEQLHPRGVTTDLKGVHVENEGFTFLEEFSVVDWFKCQDSLKPYFWYKSLERKFRFTLIVGKVVWHDFSKWQVTGGTLLEVRGRNSG